MQKYVWNTKARNGTKDAKKPVLPRRCSLSYQIAKPYKNKRQNQHKVHKENIRSFLLKKKQNALDLLRDFVTSCFKGFPICEIGG